MDTTDDPCQDVDAETLRVALYLAAYSFLDELGELADAAACRQRVAYWVDMATRCQAEVRNAN